MTNRRRGHRGLSLCTGVCHPTGDGTATRPPGIGVTLLVTVLCHVGLMEFQVCSFGYIEKLNRRNVKFKR